MNTLPSIESCCRPACDDVSTVQVPGPAGEDGDDGAAGTDGIDSFTTLTAQLTMPAELGSDTATVADSSWMAVNQIVYIAKTDGSVMGYFQVTAIGGATSITVKNLEDASTSAYLTNSAPGAIFTVGSKVCPAGIQGPTGLLSGSAAGGDLKGTYPDPTLAVGNTKGSSLWGNGTDTVAVPAGTDGHIIAYDSTDAEGMKTFAALPLTGGTDVADNRVPRLNGATGLPIPMQSSKVTITDNGAIRADGSGSPLGNARGSDAVDLQVSRANATEVASGTASFIGGGSSNTASGIESAVVCGLSNVASGQETFIGGGEANTANNTDSAIVGGTGNVTNGVDSFVGAGDGNTADTDESVVCGGNGNTAGTGSNDRAFVGGGQANLATGQESAIGGGQGNQATGTQSGVFGGDGNLASGDESFIGGGKDNTVSVEGGAIVGGSNAIADKYGQIAHASGMFATQGDAQTFELILRNSTTDATPTNLFLDGVSALATIPSGAAWIFRMLLVAKRSTGTASIYEAIGQLTNVAGTTAAAAVTVTEVNDGIGLPVTPVAVTADNANDALDIAVTGVAANNINWVAWLRVVQVM